MAEKKLCPSSWQILSYCSEQLCDTSANKNSWVQQSFPAGEQLSGASRHRLLWLSIITVKLIKSDKGQKLCTARSVRHQRRAWSTWLDFICTCELQRSSCQIAHSGVRGNAMSWSTADWSFLLDIHTQCCDLTLHSGGSPCDPGAASTEQQLLPLTCARAQSAINST